MSAFDNIASTAAREEAHVRDVATAATARVEVVVTRRHGILAVVALLAFAGAAYWQGGADGRARFDGFVAEERRVADAEHARQAAALRDVQAASDARAATAQTAQADMQGRIDVYAADLARRPADARCTLSDADLRRLRGLDAPAARPRRRPAAAPHDGE